MAAVTGQEATVPACPRCGSTRLDLSTVQYADGQVPYTQCQECNYLDLQSPPSYISPKTTVRAGPAERKLPLGSVLPLPKIAGIHDPEGIATGQLTGRFTRAHTKRS